MKNPNQLMQTLGNLPAVETAPLKIDTGTADVVNSLFKELQAIFPAWRQAWPTDEALMTAKRTWVKAFMAEGIKQIEQIRFGLQNCRKLGSDFAPSVGKFIQMCQPTPEALGIPSHGAAFAESVANAHPSMAGSREWSHQAVYHAASQCGFHALNTMKTEVSRKLFDRNYDITIRMMLACERLRNIPLALPERVSGRVTAAIGNQALADLRKSRGGYVHG